MSGVCAAALRVSVFVWFAISLSLSLSSTCFADPHTISLVLYCLRNPPHIISSHHWERLSPLSFCLTMCCWNSLQSVHWEFWECPAREVGIFGVSKRKLRILGVSRERTWNPRSVGIDNWECLEKELGILWPPWEGALLGASEKSSGHAGAKYSGLQQCLVLFWLLEWANGGL